MMLTKLILAIKLPTSIGMILARRTLIKKIKEGQNQEELDRPMSRIIKEKKLIDNTKTIMVILWINMSRKIMMIQNSFRISMLVDNIREPKAKPRLDQS